MQQLIYIISLVCEECADFNYGDCPIHGPLIAIEDSDFNESSKVNSKARASLPKGLEIKASNIQDAGEGVHATECIKTGLRFGPYQGKKVHRSLVHDGRDTSYMWEVSASRTICHFNDSVESGEQTKENASKTKRNNAPLGWLYRTRVIQCLISNDQIFRHVIDKSSKISKS